MDVASNAIAFVGLADVTLRTGSKIFDFLAAIKDAPHEIETLQRELGTINSLVAEVKASCEDPTGGQPWSLPSQALVDCTCLLKAIHQDLKILALAASNYDASKAFASTWAKIKWVFADKQVSRLSRRLESNKLSLVAALTLYERRSALLNQERMQQTIIQKSDHVLSHVIDGSEQCIKGLRELRITVSADHTRLEETARRLEKSASTIEEAVQSLPWRIQRPRVVLEKCINPKSKVAQRFGQTFEQISQLGQPAISIRSPFTNDCQDVLLSLLLIQRQLSGVFVHLNGAKDSEISKVQSNWICSEVQLFITTAIHESSDTMSCGQGPGSMTSFNPSTEDSMGVDDFASSPGRAFDLSQRLDAVRGRQKITNRVWRFETAFGCLNISKSIRRESDVGLREEFRVSFIPSLDTHSTSTAIIANFRKMFSRMKSPQIVRQLHAYTLIPYGASHGLYDIVESGSLREIANAFTTGRASPFVLDFLGRPIHYVQHN
ncbi:hypothetical protein MMC13_002427 [Lambiella insularis]|nr:hypothetical protein [Lambiella insularis]